MERASNLVWWPRDWKHISGIAVRPMLIPGEAQLASAPRIELEAVDNGWSGVTDNSTLRYECDEPFSDECEFAARAEGEWCNHTCQENVFSHEYRTKFYITRCENADFRTRSVRKTAFTHSEWYKIHFTMVVKNSLRVYWRC